MRRAPTFSPLLQAATAAAADDDDEEDEEEEEVSHQHAALASVADIACALRHLVTLTFSHATLSTLPACHAG